MTERSVTHATFVVERSYEASPARVFAAWADPAAQARWFAGPDGYYQDIVPDQRIIYTYDMHLDETRISVSLATVEFTPAGKGTRLIFTEQGAFLDGYDNPARREQGTRDLLDALGAALRREPANA